MIFNVHAGHNPDGKVACGAVDLIKESTEARKVKFEVINKLRKLGHTVYDCTVDNGTSQNDVLSKIVSKCNEHKVDIDISIHFNSGRDDEKGDGSIGGTEVYISSYNSKCKVAAEKVCSEMSKIGFKNRGVKTGSLYFLRHTNSPAMLIECCFVDDADDIKIYNHEKVAESIVKAITDGKKVNKNTKKETTKTTKVFKQYKAKIIADTLNIRSGPGTSYKIVGTVKKGEVFTIVNELHGWGKLKSGAGWISLNYSKIIKE